MATKGEIYLQQGSGTPVLLSAFGRSLIIKPIEYARTGRTASRMLRKDIIAIKYQFELPYSLIDGTSLAVLIALYDLRDELNLLIYTTNTVTFKNDDGTVPIVLMSPMQRKRLLLLSDGLWEGVSLTLDEV